MKAGHVFTVEPMINLGGQADTTVSIFNSFSNYACFDCTVAVTNQAL